MADADHSTAGHRDLWATINEQFTDEDGERRWAHGTIAWGLFERPEAELGLLGSVADLDVLDLGSGTAYLAAGLAHRGARVTALDLSHHQLVTARRCQARFGPDFPLVEADGAILPFRDAAFDLVVSDYGVAPWCDPERWLPEAARVLRRPGRLVFLTNSTLAAMTVPAEGGVAGTELLRTAADLSPVTWPGGGTEYHPSHGQWIRHLRAAGFVVDDLVEIHADAAAADHEHYEIVTARWARDWPAEEVWLARLPRDQVLRS